MTRNHKSASAGSSSSSNQSVFVEPSTPISGAEKALRRHRVRHDGWTDARVANFQEALRPKFKTNNLLDAGQLPTHGGLGENLV
jgi:hypothetical protein